MPKVKKEYLILGDNNEWYATLTRKQDVKSELKRIKSDYDEDTFNELYIYEATDITNQFNLK